LAGKIDIMNVIRKSVIAGSWYPGNPSVLRKDIERYFNTSSAPDIKGDIVGLIAPHAGYMYSGHIAAHAYRLIRGKKYDAVIVVGPSHRCAFHGVSVMTKGGYETPLGIVPINEDIAKRIKDTSAIVAELPQAHSQEHSVEIQLPFLQVALGEFSFLPLVMGDQDADTCGKLADVIYNIALDQKILIVGSSDLSHFYSYHAAKKMDSITLEYLKKGDASGLCDSLAKGEIEACGGGPMAVVMRAARLMRADQSLLLHYANSGDVTGDKSSVVGYAAAVYFKATSE